MYETNSAGENARTDRDAPHDKKPDAQGTKVWDHTHLVDLSEFVPLDMANNIDDERTKQRIAWIDGLGRAYADAMPTTEVATDGGVQTGPEPRPESPSQPTPDVTRIEAVGSDPDTVDQLTVTVHFYDGCTEHTAHVEFTVTGSTAAFNDIDVPCSMRAASPAIVEAEAAVGEHHAIQAVETDAMQLAEALAALADDTEGVR